MSDHSDAGTASSVPHTPAEERAKLLDDSLAEDVAVPLSVAAGNETAEDIRDVVSEDQVKLALRRVKDPDLNLNILDLGLIYAIDVKGAKVKVDMTLTSPGCPSGPEIMGNAEEEIKALPGVESVEMNLVWMPFWTPEKMEPRVRAYLGF
jgi:metal-sulfur cluster biosynthetic enzyme